MKTRNSFVSNSSSSSFIVATFPKQTKIKLTVEIDLEEYAKVQIRNLAELNTYVKALGYCPDWYGEACAILGEGKVILMGKFYSTSDDEIEAMLYSHGLSELMEPNRDIEILEG